MVKSGKIADEEAYKKQVFAREEESTTGIGEGIAIPHGKCDAVTKPGLAAMVIPGGVDFESLDDEPVTLLFLIERRIPRIMYILMCSASCRSCLWMRSLRRGCVQLRALMSLCG